MWLDEDIELIMFVDDLINDDLVNPVCNVNF